MTALTTTAFPDFEALVKAYQAGHYLPVLNEIEAAHGRLGVEGVSLDCLNLAGLVCRRLGRDGDAEAWFRQALTRSPAHPATLNNLGILLQDADRSEEAEACYLQALAEVPEDGLPRLNLGNLYLARHAWEKAALAYEIVLKKWPQMPEALRGLAEVHFAQGRKQEAIQLMRQAVLLRPADADAMLRLGEWCRDAGAEDRSLRHEALAWFERALRLRPEHGKSACFLGETLQAEKRVTEAEKVFRDFLAVDPDNADVINSYGILLNECKRYAEAEAAYRRSLSLKPDFAEAHNNLAVLLQKLKRFDEAKPCYERALAVSPEYSAARCNLGLWHLAQGLFQPGWDYYEARYAPDRTVAFPKLNRPQWQGEPLAGKGILIWNEQGLGDEIQFARYVSVLKAEGARHVGLICKKPLAGLLKTLPGLDALHVEGERFALTPYDYWVFPMSIPRWRCPTPADIPSLPRYLFADASRQALWAPRLQAATPNGEKRIGLVWRGRAEYTNDANRSVPDLQRLAPLWSVPGLRFFSLQKGEGEREASAPPPGQPMVNLGSDFADFMDTAAVVTQLDLVICVDTAIAHLCGALGVPCWVMLPFVGTDWRWQWGRDDTPWYPSMRLFRQPGPDAWTAVVEALQAALKVNFGQYQPSTVSLPLSSEQEALWQKLRQLTPSDRAMVDGLIARLTAGRESPFAALAQTALAQQQAGEWQAAEAAYRAALAIAPKAGALWHNFGALLKAQARYDEALAAYATALACQGDYPEGYYNRGNVHEAQAHYALAEADYRQAIALRPSYAEGWYNLGVALKAQDRPEEAEVAYRQAIALRENYSEARNNLGLILQTRPGESEAAEAEYRAALAERPRYAEAHNNLGVVLQERQDFDAAEQAFETALEIKADYPDAAWNLALMRLIGGRYAAAWPHFEARRAISRCQTFAPPVPFPEWQGEPLAGRSILVWPEQGFGDEIQCARFFSLLKANGAGRVVVACKAPLRRLFQSLPGVDFCAEVAQGEVTVPSCDLWVFSMSLPARLGVVLETLPATQPYLTVDTVLGQKFMPGLAELPVTDRRIGLIWRGSTEHPNDRHRSLPQGRVLNALAQPGVSFIDLHREAPAGGLPDFPCLPLGREVEDFAEAGALIQQLDLVITVDTAMAHLAGAMGCPVWVLLPFTGLDWRWLRTGSHSPWYPQGMRLFRQSTPGDWSGVIAEVKAALQETFPCR